MLLAYDNSRSEPVLHKLAAKNHSVSERSLPPKTKQKAYTRI